MTNTASACEHCPWRLANQGKRHRFGFFTRANLTRLWNQLRRGASGQSCHPTDPNHPDHVASGAKPGSTPRECAGSIVLIMRELLSIRGKRNEVTPETIDRYLAKRKKHGLTKKGILYWLVQRLKLGRVAFIGKGPLPSVDVDDLAIGLPAYLKD
ncbi:MAG: hypothetical protein L0312_20115 [Acidobacteria bacterium]|nr:hypothetical protein [Acidobacteriota bacterium]